MPELNISALLLFAAFVVPGAVSLQVYKLKVSTRDQTLKENLGESVVFSVVNFAILYWLIMYALSDETMRVHPFRSYVIVLFSFFVAPALWPFVLVWLLKLFERLRLIKPQANTSWDHYFNSLGRGSYVIVHLSDGGFVGGKFGQHSYASGYPESGHLSWRNFGTLAPTASSPARCLRGRG